MGKDRDNYFLPATKRTMLVLGHRYHSRLFAPMFGCSDVARVANQSEIAMGCYREATMEFDDIVPEATGRAQPSAKNTTMIKMAID